MMRRCHDANRMNLYVEPVCISEIKRHGVSDAITQVQATSSDCRLNALALVENHEDIAVVQGDIQEATRKLWKETKNCQILILFGKS